MKRLLVLAVVLAFTGGVALAVSSTVALDAGDTATVTCSGTRLTAQRVDAKQYTLTCKPVGSTTTTTAPTTTTTAPTTTTTTPSGGFPDATNTGVPPGTVLTTITGSFTIDQAYANTLPGSGTASDPYIFERKLVTGRLTVDVPYVLVRQVRVYGDQYYGIWSPVNNTTVEDSEIGPDGSGSVDNALSFEQYGVARRNNIHNGEHGVKVRSNCVLEDNYIHTFWQLAGTHNNGVIAPQANNTTVRHNTIDGHTIPSDGRNHQGISIYTDLGSSTGALIEDNYITHSGYHVYLAVSQATVQNNVLTTDFEHGTFFNAVGGTVGGGNVDENGQAVAP